MIDRLEQDLRLAEAAKTGQYDKRTEHLREDGSTIFINRLILEDSPYLLQHAHNPVNWYPWGEQAFATAARENKPVFLSIGYSTCHWCHVMEVESFDNIEVAKVLNEHFISIKLDREQYPDIDEVYMTGVQIMSGHGGWPMSNFLMSDGKPFFGGTYFPAASFIQLLEQIVAAWRGKFDELRASAEQLGAAIDRYLSSRQNTMELDPDLAETMLKALLQREDRSFGGLGGAPKFPQEPLLLSLLDRVRRNRELESLAFVDRALNGMASGGIYDQVAGGFHRYSVDAQWLVPHFEKMLYNQSQLGLAYLQAWELTKNPFFRRVCEQTLNYVVRDMQLPEGGFYSATDADSEDEEGTFFVWQLTELEDVLEKSELAFLQEVFDISADGNFESANILSLRRGLWELARKENETEFFKRLDALLRKLYDIREQRIHPLRDDKLIVAWASAMITTLARASYAMSNTQWLEAAERAAQLIWAQNVNVDVSPLSISRIYLNGATSIPGQLEDYANLAEAMLVLFDITANKSYLEKADKIVESLIAHFYDADSGSLYLSPSRRIGPQLTRSRSAADGATLSPVSTALQCLVALQQRSALLTADTKAEKWTACLAATCNGLNSALNDNPMSHPGLLRVLANQQRGSIESIQYAGDGLAQCRVVCRRVDATQIELLVSVRLQDGWHLTAPQDREEAKLAHVEPMAIMVNEDDRHWQLQFCELPSPSASIVDPSGEAVPVYSGQFEFRVGFEKTDTASDALSPSVGFQVKMQLCDDRRCLLPQYLQFRC